ncbi:hypothetical protein [Nonomuraea sp. SYSU D8015]|uniref:hypothetical protein n=1 Tax=Nonomuraea sp. SYSU D8015 TaxID=2593644 RepID=UPI001660B261|nr:hypothetical protein [Nonomuraea sp. SYSU D8015]
MLDQAAEHIQDTGHVTNCVAIADAWTRLYAALAWTPVDWPDIFPERDQSSG